MKRPTHIFAALGFTSVVCQILLMRELIVVFYGNELSLGIMLGCWLFWVGIGSLVAAQIVPRFRLFSHPAALATLQAVLGLLSVGTLMGVRALPVVLKTASTGEIVGYAPIVVSSLLVLAPLCLLLGFLFDLFCHVWRHDEEAAAIGSVYTFEAVGAAIGGFAFALILIRFLDPTDIASLLLVVNLIASTSILTTVRRLRIPAASAGLLTLAMASVAFFGGAERLRGLTLEWIWGARHIVHSEDSVYGKVALAEREEEKSLYENGLLMFSYPDRFSAEESVHFALLQHPNPKKLLLIGGGVNGSLNEALKHPLDGIDYIELDPVVIKTVRRFFPAEIREALESPRVRVHAVDGRLFVKQSAERYDIVIVNLPDPYTALINRFYTLEFFSEASRILAPDGVLSFRVSSAENYISPELQQFLGCLNQTLGSVFPHVKVIPGETNIFMASRGTDILTLDSDDLVSRLEQRGIQEQLLFIREYYLPFRLAPERKEMLQSALASAEARMNTDLSPACYYYHAVLWSKQFEDVSATLLTSFSRIRPAWILAAIGIMFAIVLLIQRFYPLAWGPKSILVSVGTTGFAEITIEIVTLLGFQAIYGYVYYKVAIIITTFMLGLTIGAATMGRAVARGGAGYRMFLLIQALVCGYPLLLLGALILLSGAGESGTTPWLQALEAQVVLPILAFFAGFTGGLQFPLANVLWLAEKPGTARAAGYTYGVDLLGSCLGAMLATAMLIPVFGIPFACIIASVLNVGSFLLLLLRPSGK